MSDWIKQILCVVRCIAAFVFALYKADLPFPGTDRV